MVQLHNIKLTHTENDYYGEIDIKLTTEGKKNTIVNVVWPMKQELPPTMEVYTRTFVNSLNKYFSNCWKKSKTVNYYVLSGEILYSIRR